MGNQSTLQLMSKIITISGKLLSYCIFVLLILVVAEVVSRYVFGKPTIWSSELQTYIYGMYFILGGAYTLLAGGHVRIETLYNKLSGKPRLIADGINFSCIAIVSVGLVWKGAEVGFESLLTGERSHTVWAPYLAPFKLAVPVGSGMLLIAALLEFIANINYYINHNQVKHE